MTLPRALAFVLLSSAVAPWAGAATACVDGVADGHACHRVDLESRLDLAQLGYGDLNDVWGWTDTVTGREYALVGAVHGTVFVDITDPADPRIVGRLPAHEELPSPTAACKRAEVAANAGGAQPLHADGCGSGGSTWRNIKTYRDHAYIGSEAAGHGLQVFDLTQLRAFPPGSPVQRFDETAHYAGFGHSHTLYVDQATGMLYAVGSDTFAGGPHFVDLAVPAAPVAAGGYDGDGYTHEIVCEVYAGPDARYAGREVCFASNEDTLTILDVTDRAHVARLSRTGYPGVGYAHQGWLTADQRFFFMNDELDEVRQSARTRTLVWDLADLTAPVLVDQVLQPRHAIDHNEYVRDGFVFQSDYTAGLVVLDGRDPRHAFEVAYFDTYPAHDRPVFDGTWSNFPFFASGVVAVSDISRGLYLLRPRLGGPASDARVTLTATGGSLAGLPGGTVTPGAAGGTFTVSLGSNATFGAQVAIDSATVAPTCAFNEQNNVMRCRLVDATPFTYAVSVVATPDVDVIAEVVAMVASGGDETAPADNRASASVAAPGSSIPVAHDGGGVLDFALLALLLGALAWRLRTEGPA